MSFLSQIFNTENNIKNITPQSLQQLMDSEEHLQLLDVRTAGEFKQKHIPKAVNIDIFKSDFEDKCQAKFDLSKPILLYCRSGQRSMNAARKLKKFGFTEVYNLKGGMLSYSR